MRRSKLNSCAELEAVAPTYGRIRSGARWNRVLNVSYVVRYRGVPILTRTASNLLAPRVSGPVNSREYDAPKGRDEEGTIN